MKTKLELEAKSYTNKKRTARAMKPLTARRYLAGQALAGLLASNRGTRGSEHMAETRRAAYDWADYMLENED